MTDDAGVPSLVAVTQEYRVKMSPGGPIYLTPDIAERFDKDHRNVCRDIDNIRNNQALLDDYELDILQWFQPTTYRNSRGKTHRAYKVTEEGLGFLGSGYDPQIRARMVRVLKRVSQQLETQRHGTVIAALEDQHNRTLVAIEESNRQMLAAIDSRIIMAQSDNEDRIMKRFGGIQKSVTHAQLVPVQAEVAELRAEVAALRSSGDPGAGYITALQLVIGAGCTESKGRRSPMLKVGNGLRKVTKGPWPMRGRAQAFPIDIARAYMQAEGNGIVAEHKAAQGKQPELPLQRLRLVR